MPDREKVIKDLEKIHTHFWVKYRGCGIKAEKAKYQERLSTIADAIALLKEREAVPVTQREVMRLLIWCCGSCGVAITDGDKFCRMCGKKVKWNATNRR